MGELFQADRALYQKAVDACDNYRRLYHVYPKKVFLHWKRIRTLPFRLMKLSEELPLPFLQVTELLRITERDEMPTKPLPRMHEVLFEPLPDKEKGSQWDEDEVYVPLPHNGDTIEVMGSAALSRLLLSMKDQVGEQEL